MAGQVSPGIVLRERDLTNQVVVNSIANTAALVGTFQKGPIGVITSITSEKELVEVFGKPNNNNYEDWFVGSTFLSYGGQLLVVRVEDTSLKNAVNNFGTSSSFWRLYVQDNGEFPSSGLVKIDNEFLFYGWKNTQTDPTYPIAVGTEYLGVSPNSGRGALGTTATSHLSGATVTLWNYADSVTDTTIVESVDATETIFDLDSSAGFAANDYARIVDLVDGDTEIVKIVSVESGDQVVVLRAQLGTTALTGAPNYTFTKLIFSATADTTTLVSDYPRVSGATAPLIRSSSDFEANLGTYDFEFAARTAGTWGNSISVAWINSDAPSYSTATYYGAQKWSSLAAAPTGDGIHLLVLDANGSITGTAGSILESYLYASTSSTATNSEGETNYYINLINRKSKYVYASDPVTVDEDTVTLAGGVDNYQADPALYQASLERFADVESINVDFILAGGSITYGVSPGLSTKVKAIATIDIATSRKDCIAFVSPYRNFVNLSSTSAQKDAILDYFSLLPSTSYAVYDSGYKYVYDRFNDIYRYVPCCGDVAGLCVQTSINSEDWFSPAGISRGNLKNAVKLAYTPTKQDRDQLYLNRINPITSFPGQGVILFGDKTALSTPGAFDRINVRRLFLAIEKRIGAVAKNVLFELNDETTRSTFFSTVNSYMGEVQAKRGVTDYLVVCDETNNTPDVIDRNEFVAEIYVKPTRSINYITITFVATRTGVSFAEVVGQV
jgi:hypothetical protein